MARISILGNQKGSVGKVITTHIVIATLNSYQDFVG